MAPQFLKDDKVEFEMHDNHYAGRVTCSGEWDPNPAPGDYVYQVWTTHYWSQKFTRNNLNTGQPVSYAWTLMTMRIY